jgi:tetratricopeptide (TPR) repeat protein
MKLRSKRDVAAFLLALGVMFGMGSVPAAPAQQGSGAQGKGQQAPKPADQNKTGQLPQGASRTAPPADAPKVDPQEASAYKAFYDLKPGDFDQQIKFGEDFIVKYPQSRYLAIIYSRLANAYYNKQQMDKMLSAGDKAVALNPDDYTVLVLMGWYLPHVSGSDQANGSQRLDKAEQYLKHALELEPAYQRPTGMTDEDFTKAKNEVLAQAHSGLGLVYFRRARVADSVAELETATKLSSNPDPTDYYVMGVDLEQLKRYGDAADAFDKCGQIQGGLQSRCKQETDKAKKLAGLQPAAPKP